jgi:hypothetical protein
MEPLAFDPDPSITVLEATWIEAALPLGDGRAVVVTRHDDDEAEGQVFVIERRGVVTTSTLAYRGGGYTALPPGFLRRDARGTLWHFGATSTTTPRSPIARGTLEGGLDVVADFNPPGSLTDVALLDAPEGGGPPTALLTMAQPNSSGGVGSRVVEVQLVGEPRAVVKLDTHEVVRRLPGNAPVLEVVSSDEFVVANTSFVSRTLDRYRRADGEWMSTRGGPPGAARGPAARVAHRAHRRPRGRQPRPRHAVPHVDDPAEQRRRLPRHQRDRAARRALAARRAGDLLGLRWRPWW